MPKRLNAGKLSTKRMQMLQKGEQFDAIIVGDPSLSRFDCRYIKLVQNKLK